MKTKGDHLQWLACSFGRTDYLPLQQADLEALLSAGEPVSKYPGTHLFREGEPGDSIFVVTSGAVKVTRGDLW